MRLLIDTCVVLWSATTPERLPDRVRTLIESRQTEVLVSVISAWEIGIKQQAGKLEFVEHVPDFFRSVVTLSGFTVLPVLLDHALLAASLPRHHGDPFDRMLIAQGMVEGVPLATPDGHFGKYPVETVW